jgi:hypothetical protein
LLPAISRGVPDRRIGETLAAVGAGRSRAVDSGAAVILWVGRDRTWKGRRWALTPAAMLRSKSGGGEGRREWGQTAALAAGCRWRLGCPKSGLSGWRRGGQARAERGRGGRGPRQCEVGEEGAHDGPILMVATMRSRPAATAGTGEDIETERPAHRRGSETCHRARPS